MHDPPPPRPVGDAARSRPCHRPPATARVPPATLPPPGKPAVALARAPRKLPPPSQPGSGGLSIRLSQAVELPRTIAKSRPECARAAPPEQARVGPPRSAAGWPGSEARSREAGGAGRPPKVADARRPPLGGCGG